MRSISFAVPVHLSWGRPIPRLFWVTLAALAGLAIAILPASIAGVALLGVAVVLLTVIEPLLGLTLTLILGPWGALENVILGGTSFDSGQLLLALTLAAWLAQALARRRLLLPILPGDSRAYRVAVLAFLGLLGAAALSLLAASSWISGIKELAKWLQIALLALMVADLGRQPGRLRWVVAAVIAGGMSQAFIGIWQFGLRGHGPEHFLILGRFYRAYGTFEQPNPFAGYLGLTLPVALGWAMGTLRRDADGRWRWWSWVLALVAPAVLAVALLMSWSRGGWLGAAAGIGAMLFFLPKRRWLGVGLVLVLVVGALLALQSGLVPSAISTRLTDFTEYVQFQDVRGVDVTVENYAVLERMAHWQAALGMADSSPWLGVGFGNYEAAYADHALINWPYPLGHAHNYYLNLLAETGILGLTAYLAFWTAVIWLTAETSGRLAGRQRWLALGLMGSWLHLSVHHLVDKLYVNNIYLHLGVLLGILVVLQQQQAARHPSENKHAGIN